MKKITRTTYSRVVANFLPNPARIRIRIRLHARGAYGTVEMQFTLENISRVFDPLYLGTLWETVKIAVITTVICLLIGYPFAYTITIVDRKYRSILLLLATIPFWINFLVRSYAWIVILRSQGLVNTLLLKLGIISEPLNLLYNTPSVILGMVYSLLPFMILPVYAKLSDWISVS